MVRNRLMRATTMVVAAILMAVCCTVVCRKSQCQASNQRLNYKPLKDSLRETALALRLLDVTAETFLQCSRVIDREDEDESLTQVFGI